MAYTTSWVRIGRQETYINGSVGVMDTTPEMSFTTTVYSNGPYERDEEEREIYEINMEALMNREPIDNIGISLKELDRLNNFINSNMYSISSVVYQSIYDRVKWLERCIWESRDRMFNRRKLLINKILQLCQNETKWL